jgi:NADH:ubiquinone oxidoreductase subunit 5 (subunit L)/multisubunit Na+/H+ antiporter MnhA subunit
MLGQTSFFLIGFFKIKISAFKSALKAFFYNRISDLLLLLAFLINLKQTNTSDIIQVDFINTNLQLVGLLITVTALIKSAQFFFFF